MAKAVNVSFSFPGPQGPAAAKPLASFQVLSKRFSPSGNGIYYVASNVDTDWSEISGFSLFYSPFAGNIKYADIVIDIDGSVGSSESISVYLRVNGTTDYLVATEVGGASRIVFSNHAMAVALAEGDFFEVKIVCPAWGTPPTDCRIYGNVFVEK